MTDLVSGLVVVLLVVLVVILLMKRWGAAREQDLTALLAEVVGAGEEFMLYYHPHDETWSFELGNSSGMVMLGEVEGNFRGSGESLGETVRLVWEAFKSNPEKPQG